MMHFRGISELFSTFSTYFSKLCIIFLWSEHVITTRISTTGTSKRENISPAPPPYDDKKGERHSLKQDKQPGIE